MFNPISRSCLQSSYTPGRKLVQIPEHSSVYTELLSSSLALNSPRIEWDLRPWVFCCRTLGGEEAGCDLMKRPSSCGMDSGPILGRPGSSSWPSGKDSF